jgi:hypothetical protein
MNAVLGRLKHEVGEVIPPTIFFFIAFNVIALTRALMLQQHGVEVTAFAGATIAALVVGKIVLLADKFPFINRFPGRPLIYNVVWKTSVYIIAALVVRYVEHLIPFVREQGSFVAANHHLFDELVWPRFWAVQIWLLVLFLVYVALRELVRALGKERIVAMFFGPPRLDGA